MYATLNSHPATPVPRPPAECEIALFFEREVKPHAPDAWIDAEATKVGYEISFTRYFYKPPALRTLDEIRADILALEKETEGLLGEIIGTTPHGAGAGAAPGGRK